MKAISKSVEYEVKHYPSKKEYVVTRNGLTTSYTEGQFLASFDLVKEKKPEPEVKPEAPKPPPPPAPEKK